MGWVCEKSEGGSVGKTQFQAGVYPSALEADSPVFKTVTGIRNPKNKVTEVGICAIDYRFLYFDHRLGKLHQPGNGKIV